MNYDITINISGRIIRGQTLREHDVEMVRIKECESIVASVLGAIFFGWCSKVAALATDPIISIATQLALRSGWVVVVVMIAFIVRMALDDYASYVSMGVFALPVIVTFLLPWDAANAMMTISVIGLALMGREIVFGRFRGQALA